jgi:hypothetical protein
VVVVDEVVEVVVVAATFTAGVHCVSSRSTTLTHRPIGGGAPKRRRSAFGRSVHRTPKRPLGFRYLLDDAASAG